MKKYTYKRYLPERSRWKRFLDGMTASPHQYSYKIFRDGNKEFFSASVTL